MSKRIVLATLLIATFTGCTEETGLEAYSEPEGAAASALGVEGSTDTGVMFDWEAGASFILVERCPCEKVCPSDEEIPNITYDTVWELMTADPDPVLDDEDLDFVPLPHPLAYGTSLNEWDEPAVPLEPGTSYRAYVYKLPADHNFTADELIESGVDTYFEVVQFGIDASGAAATEDITEDTSCL
jgi:hypothetical protein